MTARRVDSGLANKKMFSLSARRHSNRPLRELFISGRREEKQDVTFT